MFDSIEPHHFVPPILHLEIGLINLVLDSLAEELQAAMEEYSTDYVTAEKAMLVMENNLNKIRSKRKWFNNNYTQYENFLKTSSQK